MSPRLVLAATALVSAAAACGGGTQRTAALGTAGTVEDDGTGQLYMASVKYTTNGAGDSVDGFGEDPQHDHARGVDEYGGYLYGGDLYGGAVYGGASYGAYVPNVSFNPVNRTLDYLVHSLDDAGAVAGTVTWAAAPADRRLHSPCGDIDNPTLRLGAKGEAGGAIVYLDQISSGRPFPTANRPLMVGGTIERLSCALRPAAQVLAPAPSPVTIYNDDDQRDVMIARGPGPGDPVTVSLPPGGYRQVGIIPGITRIADEAGRLTPAYVIAPGHPYFAITDDAGHYRIDDVVPGTYHLVVWHPPVVTGWRDGKAVFGNPVIVNRSIKVGAYATARADVSLK